MTKYYGYEKGLPRRGFVRKALDEVVLIEESWISSIESHLGKNGYDDLLAFVATALKEDMNVNISRAQAWVILNVLTERGVPHVLRDGEIDEKSGAGSLAKDLAKAPFRAVGSVVDTASNAVVDTARGAGSMASSAVSAVIPSSDEKETEEKTEEESSE